MRTPILNRNAKQSLLALIGLAWMASACVNSRLPSITGQHQHNGSSGLVGATGPSGTTAIDNFVIGNVSVAAAPTGATAGAPGSGPAVTIYTDPSRGTSATTNTAPIVTQHCSVGTSSGASGQPCLCQFTWTETNASTGNNRAYTRNVQMPITNVQQQAVTCNAPDVYANEINDGSGIKVTVIPGPGNPDAMLFKFTSYTFTKSTTVSVGSFADAQGHAFENIMHYSCYEQFKIGTAIQSKVGQIPNSQTGETMTYPLANKFCVQKPNAQSTADCPQMTGNTINSAQAYYYNFFTRSSLAGAVNQWNDRYTCPAIKEPIYGNGTVGSQGQVYPQDTNFALSVNSNGQFNVGVNGFVELADGGGDAIAANAKTCDGQAGPDNGSTTGFVQGCLGYAAKPAADGSCPYIRDSSGAVRFTYRLRRFTALYPPLFGIDGAAPTTPQRFDQIYVLDRPVTPPIGADPMKPYTMRGPKPCPFALFDATGVLGFPDSSYPNQKLPIYGATSNSLWNGTNVDGIQIPNTDSRYSCSTALPLVKNDPLFPDLSVVSIGTVNENNPVLKHVYIRPVHAWAPHYEEDTSFQACAPQASPTRDPPLHFAKDPTTGNVAWCAEVYPSQNDHVGALDQLFTPSAPPSSTNAYIGHVRPFTSHVAKNSKSADCKATIPASIPPKVNNVDVYPQATAGTCGTVSNPDGVARHPASLLMDTKNNYTAAGSPLPPSNVCSEKTCDRTAIVSGGLGWTQFPLLATAPQTEAAISADSTYGCVMTYDAGGVKTGKTTPTGGCCGDNVIMNTGFKTTNGPSLPGLYNLNAHLEPDTPCLIPKY